jgi:hypothetical protein
MVPLDALAVRLEKLDGAADNASQGFIVTRHIGKLLIEGIAIACWAIVATRRGANLTDRASV